MIRALAWLAGVTISLVALTFFVWLYLNATY